MANPKDASFPVHPALAESGGPSSSALNETRERRGEIVLDLTIEDAADDLRIDRGSTITGNLIFDGDIILQGTFNGALRCRSLLVESGAVLQATVTARHVIIRGAANGSIEAESVRIEPTAVVDSEIRRNKFRHDETARTTGPLVALDKQATARRNKKQPTDSNSLMDRLAELRHHRQSDRPHRSPSDQKKEDHGIAEVPTHSGRHAASSRRD